MNLRICFVAPSCYGKSTASKILIKEFGGCVLKIGAPLYELQDRIYSRLGVWQEKQDGEILQFLGRKIREIRPDYLIEEFRESLLGATPYCDIIVNDDCRPADYESLKEMGFIFVKINGFVRERDDFAKADAKNVLEWQSEIPCDYELDNYGDINEYTKNIVELMEVIKRDRQVLHYTSREEV